MQGKTDTTMTNVENRIGFSSVKAVVFDAYGTLVEIGDRRAPFRQLLRIGELQGRQSTAADAAVLMSAPLSLLDAAELLGIHLTADVAAQLAADLRAEIASVRLFPDTLATLETLRKRGFRLGLCSNLAADYAKPITALLGSYLDTYVWSFEEGAIKPDPRIYARSCQALACAPAEVLMVGDTLVADVEGPRACGLQSIHLNRTRYRGEGALASLTALSSVLPD